MLTPEREKKIRELVANGGDEFGDAFLSLEEGKELLAEIDRLRELAWEDRARLEEERDELHMEVVRLRGALTKMRGGEK